MNSENLIQMLQTGFRVSIGATTSLLESLQDTQKRDEILSKLRQSEFSQLTQEWAEKGEITEREARNYVESLLGQGNYQTPSETGGTSSVSTSPTSPVTSPGVQQDLQELIAQIAAMREELEKLRKQDSSS